MMTSFPNDISMPLENASPSRSLKVAVIREEFVELTRDPRISVILGHFVEESLKVPDFDLFIAEENNSHENYSKEKPSPSKGQSTFQHGWFCKSMPELLEETLLCVAGVTFRRYISYLIVRGWLQTRTNPQYKWDRRTQYRVNLRKLYSDLQKKGRSLPGFSSHETLIFPQNDIFEHDEDLPSLRERPL